MLRNLHGYYSRLIITSGSGNVTGTRYVVLRFCQNSDKCTSVQRMVKIKHDKSWVINGKGASRYAQVH